MDLDEGDAQISRRKARCTSCEALASAARAQISSSTEQRRTKSAPTPGRPPMKNRVERGFFVAPPPDSNPSGHRLPHVGNKISISSTLDGCTPRARPSTSCYSNRSFANPSADNRGIETLGWGFSRGSDGANAGEARACFSSLGSVRSQEVGGFRRPSPPPLAEISARLATRRPSARRADQRSHLGFVIELDKLWSSSTFGGAPSLKATKTSTLQPQSWNPKTVEMLSRNGSCAVCRCCCKLSPMRRAMVVATGTV